MKYEICKRAKLQRHAPTLLIILKANASSNGKQVGDLAKVCTEEISKTNSRGDDDSSREMQTSSRRVIIFRIARRHDRTLPRASRIPPLNSRQTLSSSRIPPLKLRDAPLLFSPRARPRRKIDTFEDDYWCSFGAPSAPLMSRCRVRWSRFRRIASAWKSSYLARRFFKSASNDTGEFRRCRVVGFRRSVRC